MRTRLDIPLSVLDLSPIREGGTAAEAFRNTLDLARHAERLGYQRFWLAEHHNMPGHRQRGDRRRHRPRRRRHVPHPRRVRRHHAPEPRPARHRRAVRHARVALPGPDRPRPRPRPRRRPRGPPSRCAATSAAAATRSRRTWWSCRLLPPGRAGQRRPRGPRRGARRAVWLLGSSDFGARLAAEARPAVRLRVALRPGLPARGPRPVPPALRAVGARWTSRTSMVGVNVVRGRHRRGGAAAVHLGSSSVPEPGPRHPGPAPAAGRVDGRAVDPARSERTSSG